MVRFLADNSGMDISLLTFHGFAYDGKTFLAKQVEVEGTADPEPRPARRRPSEAEHRENLERRLEDSTVREVFDEALAMFRGNWPNLLEGYNQHGLTLNLRGRTPSGRRRRQQYARIGVVSRESATMIFFPRAKALCLDKFEQPVQEIRYDTWPRDREPLKDPDTEIHFKFNAEEWETHKERMNALTQAVYAAWESGEREDVA